MTTSMQRKFLTFTTLWILFCANFCFAQNNESDIKTKPITFHIDEKFIKNNQNDLYDIIEPVWYSVNIYDGIEQYENDLKKFTLEQRYVLALAWYIAEVGNGGHDQFYFNSTGIVAEDALKGLQAIGLSQNHKILQESFDRLGGKPSKDRSTRQDQLESSKANFSDLDEHFWDIQIEKEIINYIKKNKEKFYFSGVVQVQE